MKNVVYVALLFLGACADFKTPGENARASATAWAATLYPNTEVRVTCASWDSDGDGYVSCALAVKEKDETKLVAVECASGYSLTAGCRFPKPQLQGDRQR